MRLWDGRSIAASVPAILYIEEGGAFAAMANIFLLEDDKILSKGISIALKKTSIWSQQSMGIWKY